MTDEGIELLEKKLDRVIQLLEHPALPQRYMDIAAAAKYMGRTEAAVRHLIKRGLIPVTKIDGKPIIDRVALDKYMEKNTY